MATKGGYQLLDLSFLSIDTGTTSRIEFDDEKDIKKLTDILFKYTNIVLDSDGNFNSFKLLNRVAKPVIVRVGNVDSVDYGELPAILDLETPTEIYLYLFIGGYSVEIFLDYTNFDIDTMSWYEIDVAITPHEINFNA